jgi:hypothetical protein
MVGHLEQEQATEAVSADLTLTIGAGVLKVRLHIQMRVHRRARDSDGTCLISEKALLAGTAAFCQRRLVLFGI